MNGGFVEYPLPLAEGQAARRITLGILLPMSTENTERVRRYHAASETTRPGFRTRGEGGAAGCPGNTPETDERQRSRQQWSDYRFARAASVSAECLRLLS